jgi:hypothetical protein
VPLAPLAALFAAAEANVGGVKGSEQSLFVAGAQNTGSRQSRKPDKIEEKGARLN